MLKYVEIYLLGRKKPSIDSSLRHANHPANRYDFKERVYCVYEFLTKPCTTSYALTTFVAWLQLA